MRKIPRKVLVVAGVVLAFVIGSVAYAFWTQGGSGTGSAATGTTNAVTVNQTSTVTGLYPAGPAATLSGNFDNPNASAVFIHSVTAVVSPSLNAQADLTKPACTASDFTIAGSALVDAQIASGTSQGSWTGLTLALNNSVAANQDNCKSITVPLVYTANAS
jgi:hypothetical protein